VDTCLLWTFGVFPGSTALCFWAQRSQSLDPELMGPISISGLVPCQACPLAPVPILATASLQDPSRMPLHVVRAIWLSGTHIKKLITLVAFDLLF